MVLFIWKAAPVAGIASLATVPGTAAGLAATAATLDIPDIVQFFEQDKSRSISQLITGKSRDALH